MAKKKVQYIYEPGNLNRSEPGLISEQDLKDEEMVINIGPQHPSTHGVLRLEVVTDGEIIKKVVPHLGYLHRCFEKHAENLPYNQTIPFVDRLDYMSSMNNEHIYCMAIEKLIGIQNDIPKRVEYIRVLVAEMNRIASHFIAIGTYAVDIGAFTPFLWLVRDREHILRLLEWASGARMLYNYIWIGGLYYDLPVGFEERCKEFIDYLKPKLVELEQLVIQNKIFIERTAGIGVLSRDMAINYSCTGPILRGSGLKYDLRKIDAYSVYPEIDFEVPIGQGLVGQVGDCWDRNYVRVKECWESVKIIEQCLQKLTGDHKRTRDFDPRAACPKKIIAPDKEMYFRGEGTKGELGFYIKTQKNRDIPQRLKARGCSFSNLAVLDDLAQNSYFADFIAIIGSLDFVLGEVDR